MRTAIVSTYPPRACGIGTFSADLRATLTGTGMVTVADLVAVVHEPSSPQRRGLLAELVVCSVQSNSVNEDPLSLLSMSHSHLQGHIGHHISLRLISYKEL